MPKEELAKKAQVAEVLKDKKEEIQPVLTENSLRVLEKRYLPKDKEGNFLETPAQLFRRVAHHIAKVDLDYKENKEEVKKLEDQFYKMMAKLEFLPNSPTFWGA